MPDGHVRENRYIATGAAFFRDSPAFDVRCFSQDEQGSGMPEHGRVGEKA